MYNIRFYARKHDKRNDHPLPAFMSLQELRHYEMMAVTSPDFQDRVDELIAPYRKLIESNEGTIDREEIWGARTLAYQIDKNHKGCFCLLNFSIANPSVVEEMEHSLTSEGSIIRSLVIRTKKPVSGPSPVRLEQEKQKEEDEQKAS